MHRLVGWVGLGWVGLGWVDWLVGCLVAWLVGWLKVLSMPYASRGRRHRSAITTIYYTIIYRMSTRFNHFGLQRHRTFYTFTRSLCLKLLVDPDLPEKDL